VKFLEERVGHLSGCEEVGAKDWLAKGSKMGRKSSNKNQVEFPEGGRDHAASLGRPFSLRSKVTGGGGMEACLPREMRRTGTAQTFLGKDGGPLV